MEKFFLGSAGGHPPRGPLKKPGFLTPPPKILRI